MTETKTVMTYSSLRAFRNCRMAYKLRYVDGLVPIEEPEALVFGRLIHAALATWYASYDMKKVLMFLAVNAGPTHKYLLSKIIMERYTARYALEEFASPFQEYPFDCDIVNPETGVPSATVSIAGVVDGMVTPSSCRGNELYLIEHKTARSIDAAYIENLNMDFQTTLYAYCLRKKGFNIVGIIYNIIAKTQLRQSVGETEDEFQARRAVLIAKSKTGKSSAKRKMPETDYDFSERLNAWYKRPGAFHREVLFINQRRYEALERELWILAQALKQCVKDGLWYSNQSQCLNFGRCPYLPICSSDCNPNIIANLFKKKEPHSELQKEEGF